MSKMTLQQMITQLAGGMAVSTQIFVITLLFSLPLGLVIAFGRMSKNKLIQTIVKVYISIMRGTPLMLQLMVVYFGPYYLFRIKVGSSYRLWATFIGFVINYAAYFAEIYRSGIQSMPVGQYEAAEILGYGKAQTFFKIILPQVIKRILPSVTNEVITLVKDTSLAFTLSVAEMFSIAKALAAGAVLRGAAMYSSMEPCSRRASEPESCTQLIIRHGFARAAFALYEPDCFVCCRGALTLREAGLDVRAYPALATDAAPLLAAAMLCADSVSSIEDVVFERRFGCAEGFAAFGAAVQVQGRTLDIRPVRQLQGACTRAADLRGGAALVVAALAARGRSRITDTGYIDRGYAGFAQMLAELGAQIEREMPRESASEKKTPSKKQN